MNKEQREKLESINKLFDDIIKSSDRMKLRLKGVKQEYDSLNKVLELADKKIFELKILSDQEYEKKDPF